METLTTLDLRDYVTAHSEYEASRRMVSGSSGPLLRKMRRDAKLSLNEVALRTGLTISYLSKVECGHYPLGADLAAKYLTICEG